MRPTTAAACPNQPTIAPSRGARSVTSTSLIAGLKPTSCCTRPGPRIRRRLFARALIFVPRRLKRTCKKVGRSALSSFSHGAARRRPGASNYRPQARVACRKCSGILCGCAGNISVASCFSIHLEQRGFWQYHQREYAMGMTFDATPWRSWANCPKARRWRMDLRRWCGC